MWLDVDTAITVFVNTGQLIDDTDFKTIEEAIAYDAAGMDLNWNFETTAGVITQINVTPTTGGDYDWTHVGNGIYKIEIPASGGVSANNDTEGFGYFSGFITGVLPFRGPTYGFRAAALNNALIDGGDVLDVNLTEIGGVAQSATDLKDFADAGYDPATNKVEGVKTVDTTTTNTDMRGTDGAAVAGDDMNLANDAITSAKYDETTAHPIKSDDSGSTEIARTGADGDTLEDISDQIDTLRVKKNVAISNFEFYMVDSTDHVTGKTGLTVTSERSIDGGAFVATTNSASEVSGGVYKINLSAADLNGNVISLKFTSAGADARLITIVTNT
jgi:hypothetical protein